MSLSSAASHAGRRWGRHQAFSAVETTEEAVGPAEIVTSKETSAALVDAETQSSSTPSPQKRWQRLVRSRSG